MDEITKKILLSVEIDAAKPVEAYGKLKVKVDELREAQKSLDKSTEAFSLF